MKKLVPVLQLAAAVLLCSTTSAAPGDENWENFPLPPGLDGPVSAMTTVGKNLYVAGDFKNAGAVAASGLASWNGQQWTALLSADDFFGSIYTLASDGRNLIVGGTFTISSVGATNIAKWNGASWERLGDGLREECRRAEGVFALASKGKQLYAGGKFSLAGSVAANNVAVWDGQQWAALGAGIGRTDGGCAYEPVEAVQALAIQGNNLLAGGRFHTSGSLRVTNIAAWDGRSWSGVGGGIAGGTPLSIFHDGIVEDFFGQVGALLVSGGNLYAGGSFRTAGNATATNIALWNGKSWQALDGGLGADFSDGIVSALAAGQRGLVVGGSFNRAGSVTANNVAQWNGSAWSAVGAGFSGPVHALADALYAGGEFGLSGQTQTPFISRFDGQNWTPLQPGTGNAVIGDIAGLATAHGKTYLFGNITSAGSVPAQNVVAWDGSSWNNLGGGIAGFPSRGVVARSNLYLLGYFQLPSVGVVQAACWNGQNWSTLPALDQFPGNALNPLIALAGDDTHLYVAAFDRTPNRVALFSWNGAQWASLGTATLLANASAPAMLDITASEGHLYAFGTFDQIGGVAATNIAQWNGQNWQALGGGLADLGFTSPMIQNVAVTGSRLFVFTSDLSTSGRSSLASWDGAAWQSLLDGTYLPVSSLAAGAPVCSPANPLFFYVGGYFTQLGGVAANFVIGSGQPLASGLNDSVAFQGLAADEWNLCTIGRFTTAGAKSSYHFAIWHQPFAGNCK